MEKNLNQFEEVKTELKSKNVLKSFGEQYLEKPVMKGDFEHNAKVTITTCTFRNIPTIDDF
ncbi:MAG: hypothetical protein R3342_07030 [Lutibacter sp.]|uniref:hypothetical protein n=1 Tax=Lutibacter sp. TaxID=1925666 RepID=UPI00299DEE49|nr:hypothetical protein [Lutibacter sp.]MDX1829284.1 hypothetical protein [Lutibacter sp.]